MINNNQNTRSILKKPRFALFCLSVGTVFILSTSDASAVQAGEMQTSVNYLKGLLDNNIVPAIIGTGVVAGTGFAFIKSSFSPLVIALSTGVGYAFANKWITTVYAICV